MQMFSHNLSSFKSSLSPKYNRDMVFKAGEGAGRSGSFFFFSHDRKFIIKTMTKSEHKLYLSCLPAFSKHYLQNKNSQLAKIFGVFTINTEYMKEVYVMLMENTVQLHNPAKLTHMFDLKGSLVDRLTKGVIKPSSTLKDQNFMQLCQKKERKSEQFIRFASEDRYKLKLNVKRDVKFLKSQGLMDYSLLLCIEKKSAATTLNFYNDKANYEDELSLNHQF